MPLFFALGADIAVAAVFFGLLVYLYRVARSRALWGAVQYGFGHFAYSCGSMAAELLAPEHGVPATPLLWAGSLVAAIAVTAGALLMLHGVVRLFDYRPATAWPRTAEATALGVLLVPLLAGWGPAGLLQSLDVMHAFLVGVLALFTFFVRIPPYRNPALLVSLAAGCLTVLYIAEPLLHRYLPDSTWVARYEAWVSLDLALWMTISYAMLMLASFRAMRAYVRSAREDPLTRALNRLGLKYAYEKLRVHAGKDEPLALLMVDIDHFKAVNDTHGHAGGDEVIKAFAAVLAACVRRSDIIARVGGEEFVVLLPGASREAALRVAEAIRSRTEATDVFLDTGDIRVTASVGVAIGRVDGTIERLMAEADAALYRAKQNGRNRVEVAETAATHVEPATLSR